LIPPAQPPSKPKPSEPGPSKPEHPEPLPNPSKPSSPEPLPPGKPSQPKPLPPVKPTTSARPAVIAPELKTRPKPSFVGRPPQLDGRVVLFEGTFRHEEHDSFTTETRLTGNAKNDKQALINLARKKYPTGRMELKSTRIVTREAGAPPTFAAGSTFGQLFGGVGSATEVSVEVGTVFFDGVRCQIFLRNLRSRNCVTFSLRQPTGGFINFSNQIQANRLANELKTVLREVLGNNVRELVIALKEEVK
jgi:hypothetical protein